MSRGVVSFKLDFQPGVDRTESTRHRSLELKLEPRSLQVMNSQAWPRSSLQWSLDSFFVDESTSHTVNMVMICKNHLKWCSVDKESVHMDGLIHRIRVGALVSFSFGRCRGKSPSIMFQCTLFMSVSRRKVPHSIIWCVLSSCVAPDEFWSKLMMDSNS
jgi:hypothetical protein